MGSGRPIVYDGLALSAKEYLSVPKDVVDGKYDYLWPTPGNGLRIELKSSANRSVRFFIDIRENRRETSLIVGATPARKATSQSRESTSPYFATAQVYFRLS